ncbi:MAG: Hsp20/alpha crystallin family protein [Alphaproteobacteria bacterium]|nr:MAG: Hsp20/alpha crystallin family protein [Alphaproteobacteria bacterium]
MLIVRRKPLPQCWHSPLDSAKEHPKSIARGATRSTCDCCSPRDTSSKGCSMITAFADPFDALLSLQRELEARFASDWLHDMTTSRGPFPPINVFQQGDDILALMELPGIDKNDLQIQAQANTIRISGRKRVDYSNGVSVHRRERVSGEFDRTLSLPVQVDPDRIKAQYRDGLLALFLPRAESDKPHSIKIK